MEDLQKNFIVFAASLLFVLVIVYYTPIDNMIYRSLKGSDGAINPIYNVTGPIQTQTTAEEWIEEHGSWTYRIIPVADYEIEAVLGNRQKYSDDWSWLSPYDFALAWGKIVEPEYLGHVTFTQGNRKDFFTFDRYKDLRLDIVTQSSSNTHIIPADYGVNRILNSADEMDVLRMKGHLVNIEARKGSAMKVMHTSISRDDMGDGACEIFYVKEAEVIKYE